MVGAQTYLYLLFTEKSIHKFSFLLAFFEDVSSRIPSDRSNYVGIVDKLLIPASDVFVRRGV